MAVQPTLAGMGGDDQHDSSTERPYYFSGPCTSQGSWTQQALNQTQRLREITTQLRDDPNCKALGDSLQRSFLAIQESLENTQKSMNGNENTQRNLGQEIKALREATIENPILNGITHFQILRRLFDFARNQAASNDMTNANPAKLSLEDRSALLKNFGDRLNRVAGRGFTIFNQTIDALPKMNECLTQKNAAGQVFAASVSMLGALVSSGQDPMGNQTAAAISKIANYMRDSSFSQILSKLNQQEFLSSVQCIMETTSESFCSARDHRLLYKQMLASLQVRKLNQDETDDRVIPTGRKFENPLQGFYILTQQSPAVTDWLFRIQIGSTPKLKEDGQYQIRVLSDANNFYLKLKELESDFNNTTRNIQTFKDFSSKQNFAKDLIISTGKALLSAGGSTGINFFQAGGSSFEVYFRLIGMETPTEVREKGGMMTPDMWYDINYRQLPIFQNPDNVPNIVKANLDKIFEAGRQNMIGYYFNNFVVDKLSVIDESLIGIPYNIKSALASIDRYLASLQERILTNAKDPTIVGSIADTRRRLGKIFYRYNDLLKFINANRDFLNKRPTADEENKFKSDLYKKNMDLMEEVYTQLEVMLAKSGYLANRLIIYVAFDYQMFVKETLKNKTGETDRLYKEIAYASGRMIFDQLTQMSGLNHTNFESDLDNATRIFKENLATQEMIFTDALVGFLQKLRLSGTKPYVDSGTISYDSISRAYQDGWKDNSIHHRNSVLRFVTGIWNAGKALFNVEEQKYPVYYLPMIGIRDDIAYSIDDENQSSLRHFNRLCIQALSFNNYKTTAWRALYNLCRNTQLKSPFNLNQVRSVSDGLTDDYLSVDFEKKFREDLPDYRMNHSKRICAFRDYNRRNLVVQLTLDFKIEDQLENSFSDNPYSEINPDPAIPSVKPDTDIGNDSTIPTMEKSTNSEPYASTHTSAPVAPMATSSDSPLRYESAPKTLDELLTPRLVEPVIKGDF